MILSDIKLWDIQGEYFSGKYDLAGSEFKIWPSNYDLKVDNFSKKNKNYPHPDHNLGQILDSDPARSYFPLKFPEI